MGAEASRSGQPLKRHSASLSVENIKLGREGEGYFRNESGLLPFAKRGHRDHKKVIRVHTPDDLVNLLTGCYEQLNDIPEILETLIQVSSNKANPMITALEREFNTYIAMSKARNEMTEWFLTYGQGRFYRDDDGCRKNPEVEKVTGLQLFQAIQAGFSGSDNESLFKHIRRYYSHATPDPCLSPLDLPSKVTGHSEMIKALGVLPHGISSNGKFLFVLCTGGYLQIAPLMNMGCMLKVVTQNLQVDFKFKSSLIAKEKSVVVMTRKQKYVYAISDLLAGIIKPEVTEVPKSESIYVSDGISIGKFGTDKSFSLIENEKVSKKLQLVSGYAKLRHVDKLFPVVDYESVPMVMNGAFVGFIFRYSDPKQAILRVFSLVSGKHVGDHRFSCPELISAATFDAMNLCYWAVVVREGRPCIQRFDSPGSMDPGMLMLREKVSVSRNKEFTKMLESANSFFIHYFGSRYVLKQYVFGQGKDLHSVMLWMIANAKSPQVDVLGLQILVVAVDWTLKGMPQHEAVRETLLDLVAALPPNLGIFLFFQNIRHAMFQDVPRAIEMLVSLFEKAAEIGMISLATGVLDKYRHLSTLPFYIPNAFQNLLPADSIREESVSPARQALVYIHQRHLIRETYLFLGKYQEIQYIGDGSTNTFLDFFSRYTEFLFSRLINIIDSGISLAALEDSFILQITVNFLHLSTFVSHYHIIAQILTKWFSRIVDKIDAVLSQMDFMKTEDMAFSCAIRFFLFTYGKLSATLLQGRSLSEFEKKFIWLISTNLGVGSRPGFLSKEMTQFKDTRINDFISASENEQMNQIYKVWRPAMNRRLSEQIKFIDRSAIVTFAWHMGLLEELFAPGDTVSQQLKLCLEQMLRVRNEVRNKIQKGEGHEAIAMRILMLQRMQFRKDVTPKDLADFVCCDEQPESIRNMINRQTIRTAVTESGFQVMYNALGVKSNPLLIEIFSWALTQIESFECLAQTMKINLSLTKEEGMAAKFCTRMLELIRKGSDGNLILASFRLFRDCDLGGVRQSFLHQIMEIFFRERKSQDKALFALVLSMINSLDRLPEKNGHPMEFDLNQSPMGWLLISVAFQNVPAPVSFYEKFKTLHDEPAANMERILSRVMFTVLNSEQLEEKLVRAELSSLVKKIGCFMSRFTRRKVVVASEMIWILRRILIEKTRAQPILLSILAGTSKKDETELAGLFAILGGNLEFIRPYCNIKYHESFSSISDFIAVPKATENNVFICYSRPFVLKEQAHERHVDRTTMVYAVPVLSLTPESFGDFDFILSFFDWAFDNLGTVGAIMYMQTLAHYLTFDEFVDKLTPEMIDKLWTLPLPFNNIESSIKVIRQYQEIQVLPSRDDMIFSAMYHAQTMHVSYVSPQLRPEAVVKVKYSAELVGTAPKQAQFVGYFGIISDTMTKFHTRFSLVCIPTGVHYPSQSIRTDKPVPLTSSFAVHAKRRLFKWGDTKFEFPYGTVFRIILCFPKNYKVTISVSDEDAFDVNAVAEISQQGGTQSLNSAALFKMPDVVKQIPKLVPNLSVYPDLPPLIPPIPPDQKVFLNFVNPPSFVPIHIGSVTHASRDLICSFITGVFKTIALQYSTICLMRIVKRKPEAAKDPYKLFALTVVPMEPFSHSELAVGAFPFNFRTPVWERSNVLYMSLENDAKECVLSLLNNDNLRNQITRCVFRASESRHLHLICYPHSNHRLVLPRERTPVLKITSKSAIVSVNCFTPYMRVAMENGYPVILPMVVTDGPTEKRFNPHMAEAEKSVFFLSSVDNSFAFDTAFEILLVLKNLAFKVQTAKERTLLKSAYINMFIAQSFVVFPFLSPFTVFLGHKLPAVPSDNSKLYTRRVAIMGSMVKRGTYGPTFPEFVKQEASVLGSDGIAHLARYFPEFSAEPVTHPESQSCRIPVVSLDPATISGDIPARINDIVLMSQPYTDLKGFPFWLVFPYWVRISDAWQTDIPQDSGTAINPIIEKREGIVHISNPGSTSASIRLTYLHDKRFPRSGMLMMATTPTFENAEFIVGREVGKSIELKAHNQIFLSLLDVPGGFDAVKISTSVTKSQQHSEKLPEEINIDRIHDQFVSDMYDFAVRWTNADTEELNLLLPRYALRDPTFATVEGIAAGSSLCQKFPSNVVILRAMIFHHFNWIRWKYYQVVPPALWSGTRLLVSCEEAQEVIAGKIVVSSKDEVLTLHIDRHAAQSLVVEGTGQSSNSIIAQMTTAFRKGTLAKLQVKKRPWKVKFTNERAIDAGGPARELVTEAAGSIFEPTTGLFIPVPNGRRNDGSYKETFIPFSATKDNLGHYTTIGHYLGVILRTGLAQYLPFAPIVWKYIAGEKIGLEDVLEVDDALRDHVTHLRNEAKSRDFSVRVQVYWSVENWDGSVVVLPGHVGNVVVKTSEVEQYIQECASFRIDEIKQFMKVIRTAFRDNVGYVKHDAVWGLLTGTLLSRMAQGNSVILAEHLKKITLYVGYEGETDPVIVNFWKAVSRFTPEQMKLLLKFITTLTRLPNFTNDTASFHITIDKLNPKSPVDETLPTVSTCFNRLHLPPYTTDEICYQKLLYAVQFCQTMENK